MTLQQLIVMSIVLRIAALNLQRYMGISWNFHPDASYYVDQVTAILQSGISSSFRELGYENLAYPLIGYIFQALTASLLPLPELLIIINIACAAATIRVVGKIISGVNSKKAPLSAYFLAFSPYAIHISIHPLKDGLAILLSASLLYCIVRRSWALATMLILLLIATRFYLGIATAATLVAWSVASRRGWKSGPLLLATIAAMGVFYLITRDFLAERVTVQFDGRDFFPEGMALVPENALLRFFAGWFFNFLIPYPFIPSNLPEFGYLLHQAVFWGIFLALVAANLQSGTCFRGSAQAAGVALSALFLLSFVVVTTASAGPLVRYRLFPELLLLISLELLRRGPNWWANISPAGPKNV